MLVAPCHQTNPSVNKKRAQVYITYIYLLQILIRIVHYI